MMILSMHGKCVWSVNVLLPALRYNLAHELRKRGFSQTKIAKLLDTTQASVSYYLNHKKSIPKTKIKKEMIKELADLLIKTENFYVVLCEACKRVQDEKVIKK